MCFFRTPTQPAITYTSAPVQPEISNPIEADPTSKLAATEQRKRAQLARARNNPIISGGMGLNEQATTTTASNKLGG